jgi:hypothetical protein
MEVSGLIAGARVVLEDGSIAEVLAPTQDGRAVRVRYLESPFDPKLVGTEASCTDYDILAFASGTELNSASLPD